MARRAVPLGLVAAALVAVVLVGLTAGPVVALLMRATDWRLDPADWAAVRFTVLQAALSALVSVALAIPVARALARRVFPGRRALIAMLGAPFLLPVIVAVMGLVAVFGRSGLVNEALALAGLPPVSLYGLHGVVLAHVFFNMPLAVRMILQGWQAIPAERFRLAAALGMPAGAVFRHIEWPLLRATVPGAAVAIFLICLTSFAVALILGGGPRATTVELAIYQALRFDFDLGRAALLAMVQLALGVGAVVAARRLTVAAGFGAGLDRAVPRWDAAGWALRAQDAAVLALAAGFLLVPLAAVVARGLPELAGLPASVWQAAGRSVAVALVSALLCTAAALTLALAARSSRLIEPVAMLPLAMSSLALGTGLFLIVHPLTNPARLALPVTALVNATLALPFAYRVLVAAVAAVETDYGRLADAIGLRGAARLRWVILPRLRRPLGYAAGLAAALSMGDLGVIALFAGESDATLPLQVFRLMGAYRTDDAAGAAVLLLIASFGLFVLFDQGGHRNADA